MEVQVLLVQNLLILLFLKTFKITVIDCLTYASDLKRIKHLNKDIRFFKIDINNKKNYRFFLKNDFDYVINFAAETHVDRSIDGSDIFVKTNINGTVNVLEGLRLKKNLKIIFTFQPMKYLVH